MVKAIGNTIDPGKSQFAAVIGMRNPGNAFVKYMEDKRDYLEIVASFDKGQMKISKQLV